MNTKVSTCVFVCTCVRRERGREGERKSEGGERERVRESKRETERGEEREREIWILFLPTPSVTLKAPAVLVGIFTYVQLKELMFQITFKFFMINVIKGAFLCSLHVLSVDG